MSSPLPIVDRLRQNHAVEHATIHLLSDHLASVRLVGRSTYSGFLLFGEVATEEVADAVIEALDRLQHGETELAIHPNCGSNIVVGGVMAGLAAWLATRGRRRSVWEQVPSALLAATIALLFAQPLGTLFQKHVSTASSVAGVRLRQVLSGRFGTTMAHRVELTRR